jgi:hypothetical protein
MMDLASISTGLISRGSMVFFAEEFTSEKEREEKTAEGNSF